MRGIIRQMEQRASIENPRTSISSATIIETLGLGESSAAGVSVNQEKALGLTAFWAGVRSISQTIASLPCEVFERQGRGQRLAAEHAAHRLLYVRPNPDMSPFTFKELRIAHLLCWGNSYAEIERNGAGRPVGLWPLLPDRTGVEIRDGKKLFWTHVAGSKIWLAANRVLHVPGMGFDGLVGYNVIKIHRDSLGLSLAANEYGARFFGNSAKPSGLLTHPGKPSRDERQEFREEWNQAQSGLTNAQRTAVLWGGMEWKGISLPPEEAQFLQTRETQIEEIARILNLNPILLQHFSKATTWGSGVAQFLVAFGKFTIAPWVERDEDTMNWDLFSESEHGRYYVKYNLNALLRGDAETQAKVLEIKRRNGIISADEWRELDEENPLPDGLGKGYFMPLNMAPMEQILAPQPAAQPAAPLAPQQAKRSAVVRQRLRDAHLAALEDGARRYVKRDVVGLRQAVKRAAATPDPAGYIDRWCEEFYPGQQTYIAQIMLPLVAALVAVVATEAADEVGAEAADTAVFSREYTNGLAMREAGASRGQVRALVAEVPADDLADMLLTRADEWTEIRPGKVAANEVVRVATGAARFAWAGAGIAYLVWRASPDACPLCQEMDGKRCGIADHFLTPGESVTSDERPGGLVASQNSAGPPLHQGCTCNIVAER